MKKIRIKGVKTEVNRLGMGCFALGGPFRSVDGSYYAYGNVSEENALKTLTTAIDMGINLFDTANVYGAGRSEAILGKALKEYRDDMVIATKFASRFVENKPMEALEGKSVSEEEIRSALDGSMRRLQTDFIDIYQLHSSSHEKEDAPRIKQVLEDLVQEGRIGGYGWSTDDPDRMGIFTNGQANSVQFIINVLYRNDRMNQLLEDHELAGLIRSPFASGTLTEKYLGDYTIKDEQHMLANVDLQSERRKTIKDKLLRAIELFKEDGRTLVQGQLGYILAQGDRIIPIPGSKSVEQIRENGASLEMGPISKDLVQSIDEIFIDMQTTLFNPNGEMDRRHLIKK